MRYLEAPTTPAGRRRLQHALVVVCASVLTATGLDCTRAADLPRLAAVRPPAVAGASAAAPVGAAVLTAPEKLALRALELPAPAAGEAAGPWESELVAASAPAFEPAGAAEPVAPTVLGPQWVRNSAPTSLWSSNLSDARAFTDLPAGSYLRVQGPAHDGRLPVYYVGDGLLRRPGAAWVDAPAVAAVDPPAPGVVPQVDALAQRPLPSWVQAHRVTTLWSGPDERAVRLTDLPQWTFLNVAGIEKGGRLLVEYAGDFASRQPGVGWVDQAAVGPAGDPGRWLQNHRVTALWSGPDLKAQRFTDLLQWTRLRIVEGAPSSPERVMVEYFGDGATRKPGAAWVNLADVGAIPPPVPLPTLAQPAAPNAPVETRTFSSQSEFIDAVGSAARRLQQRTGVPASVTVAQAILESDWGRSRLSRQANNFFGMKALGGSGPAGSVTLRTWEHLEGQDVVIDAAFKAYHTIEESIDDHGRLFQRNRRYADALAVAGNAAAFARAIQAAGYATDPEYASKLIRLMDRYNLYRFDTR